MPKAAVPTGNVFLTGRWAGDALPQFVWGPICGFAVRLQAPRLGQGCYHARSGVSFDCAAPRKVAAASSGQTLIEAKSTAGAATPAVVSFRAEAAT